MCLATQAVLGTFFLLTDLAKVELEVSERIAFIDVCTFSLAAVDPIVTSLRSTLSLWQLFITFKLQGMQSNLSQNEYGSFSLASLYLQAPSAGLLTTFLQR